MSTSLKSPDAAPKRVINLNAASIQRRVDFCAENSVGEESFFQAVATDVAKTFDASIVAVAMTTAPNPMMVVLNPSMSSKIDRNAVRDLLKTAPKTPVANRLPAEQMGTDADIETLRIQISAEPHAAILIIRNPDASLTTNEKIESLKRLFDYSGAINGCLSGVIAAEPPKESDESTAMITQSRGGNINSVNARTALAEFHRDLDLDATAIRIANESRRLIGCDRVTVLTKTGSKFKVTSVSGIAVVDKRSNAVKAIERLATHASVMGQSLVLPPSDPLPPQIQEPLDDYLDISDVMKCVLVPIHSPVKDDESDAESYDSSEKEGPIIAMMAVEYFDGEVPDAVTMSAMVIASEAKFALQNSIDHSRVFGLSLWKSVGKVTHSGRLPYLLMGLVAAMVIVMAMALIQIEHDVIATGTIQPTNQKQVFAGVDGIVNKIYVVDGQHVTAGTPLIQLENADLENRAESLAGEILTATRQLSSIQSVRLSGSEDAEQTDQLAIQESQLFSELKSLREQQDLVQRQQEDLTIVSPIDGTVVAWQLDTRLNDRPISRGNLLLRVVDQTGPWSLKLNIPDHRAGAVINQFGAKDSLPVQFAVATDPDASLTADLVDLATAARLDETGQHVFDGIAHVHPSDAAGQDVNGTSTFEGKGVRVGADVTARIACDKRSVLRSWFSDVIDFVDRKVIFYFR